MSGGAASRGVFPPIGLGGAGEFSGEGASEACPELREAPRVCVGLSEGVDAILRILGARDPLTYEHSKRVARIAARMARRMRFSPLRLRRLIVAAELHDIGKIGVPDRVLNKPGLLTEAERRAIQEHSRIGFEILAGLRAFRSVARIVLYHHERFDGRGYPEGLAGERIPLESRVIALADAFDAMTSARPYRPALSAERALEEIRAHRGDQFDPGLVGVLEEILPGIPGSRSPLFARSAPPERHEDLMHSIRVLP